MADNEIGITLWFDHLPAKGIKPRSSMNTPVDQSSFQRLTMEADLIRQVLACARAEVAYTFDSAAVRVVMGDQPNTIVIILPRPQNDTGKTFDTRLASALTLKSISGDIVLLDDESHMLHTALRAKVRMPKKLPREMNRKNLTRIEDLGSGVAGEVFKAVANEPKLNIPACKFVVLRPLHVLCVLMNYLASDMVAVKLVKEGVAATKEDLLREAALIAMLDHENVVGCVGVVSTPADMVCHRLCV